MLHRETGFFFGVQLRTDAGLSVSPQHRIDHGASRGTAGMNWSTNTFLADVCDMSSASVRFRQAFDS
jgi:hypothetical protein